MGIGNGSQWYQNDFFFNDTATTEIYTLSLHDALPISARRHHRHEPAAGVRLRPPPREPRLRPLAGSGRLRGWDDRSEEHTSELQSRQYLVCRLLLEKKQYILHSLYIPSSLFCPQLLSS